MKTDECSGCPPSASKQRPGLCGGKYVKAIRGLLKRLRPIEDDPKRELYFDDYVCFVLLHLFNPELDSLRVLQMKSEEQSFQQRFALPRFSLGSFSEAGGTFPAAHLLPILQEVFDRLPPRPLHRELLALTKEVVAFDGSLLNAMATMDWAHWREQENAAKMHAFYSVTRGAPWFARLTDANTDERAILQQHIAPNLLYVIDRGLRDYSLLNDILKEHSSFVLRSPENISYKVSKPLPLSEAAQEAGVQSDEIVRVGCHLSPQLKDRDLRLVKIHVRAAPTLGKVPKHLSRKCKFIRVDPGEHTLILLTDLLELDVLLIALLYRCRWEIEIFFRWYKHLLKADHLLSQRPNGLLILIYCAILATLLLTVWADARPTKYLLRQVSANLMGTLTDSELQDYFHEMAQPKKIG
jgi:hypothetical protein